MYIMHQLHPGRRTGQNKAGIAYVGREQQHADVRAKTLDRSVFERLQCSLMNVD